MRQHVRIGFQVTAQQGTGAVILQPLIQGTATGITFAVNPANQYTLQGEGSLPGVREGIGDLSFLLRQRANYCRGRVESKSR